MLFRLFIAGITAALVAVWLVLAGGGSLFAAALAYMLAGSAGVMAMAVVQAFMAKPARVPARPHRAHPPRRQRPDRAPAPARGWWGAASLPPPDG